MPIPRRADLTDYALAIGGDGTNQHLFSALRTPDEVVDDEVDPMFITLIIHVESTPDINGVLKPLLPAINGRKPFRRNPPNHGLKPRGLRRV